MDKKRLMAFFAAGVLSVTTVNPVFVMADTAKESENSQETESEETDSASEDGTEDSQGVMFMIDGDTDGVEIGEDGAMVFSEDGTPISKTIKASKMGMPSQDSYEYPFMGLKAVLPDDLKKQMDNGDVVMISAEDWTDDMSAIKYAYLHWSKLTEEQKDEEVNMVGTGYEDWLASIERIGTLGMYSTDVGDDLDEITGCTEHKELGESADGKYKYYLSTNKDADADLVKELEDIETTFTEMTPFNGRQSAFDEPSEATNTDAQNVGSFETTDIDGNTYTEKVFSDYDLTLVNAFTTWCSPCVNEMPELEKLYEEMKNQGVGVVGMVLDTIGNDGSTDEDTVKKAQALKEKTGVTYPLLIPDADYLNGRISGLQSFPESFFVDKDGNIVGDAIMGSNDFEGWKEAVEAQLAEIKGNN